jgi:hypothetical protein
MDIEEIRNRKLKAEQDISQILYDFMDSTSTIISDINLDTHYIIGYDKKEAVSTIRLVVEM